MFTAIGSPHRRGTTATGCRVAEASPGGTTIDRTRCQAIEPRTAAEPRRIPPSSFSVTDGANRSRPRSSRKPTGTVPGADRSAVDAETVTVR